MVQVNQDDRYHTSDYLQGRQDAIDECSQRHLARIADVLAVIDQHAGDVEELRTGVLAAFGHGGAA
jgi:hypothetical protein